MEPDEVQLTEDGRCIVYVALGSHASFNKAAIIQRIGGMTNDATVPFTTKWEPTVVYVPPATDPTFDKVTMGWIYYQGGMAPDGILGPAGQTQFHVPRPETESVAPAFMSRQQYRSASSVQLMVALLCLFFVCWVVSIFITNLVQRNSTDFEIASPLVWTLTATLFAVVGVVFATVGGKIITQVSGY